MLTLHNPQKSAVAPVQVEALADTGAVHLCIPQSVASELELEETERKEVVVADGRQCQVPYVGSVEIRFKNRTGFTGAIVIGDQVLLGAIPMEDMDLVVTPRDRKVDVNPASPDIACSSVK